MIHKWIMKDDSVTLLCESCSKKDYKTLIIREQWKAKDKHTMAECGKCGKKEEIIF